MDIEAEKRAHGYVEQPVEDTDFEEQKIEENRKVTTYWSGGILESQT